MIEVRLSVIALPGLSPDSLGYYLASLGLLRVLSRRWPSTRIAWRDEVLQVVGGPATLDELLDELVCVATKRSWTPYERGWLAEQRKGTKLGQNKTTASQSGAPVATWRAAQTEEAVAVLDVHIVATTRQIFNPLTGNGGSAGNRDFTDGWKRAITLLAGPGKQDIRGHLRDMLLGGVVAWLVTDAPLEGKKKKGSLNAASWFSSSNKIYNNGQKPSREAGLSPWAMALACEGLLFFAGGASRRLGSRSRAVGAFPFVTQSVAPETAGEAGRILGEIWAPLWTRPMSLAETSTLFSRGRAELRGRGALTPAAFATAIRKRGVDGGVSEFRRFTLGRTTSANTFEPRLEARFSLDTGAGAMNAAFSALERVTALIEQHGFPRDRKVGQRWRFEGLRGPIEAALLDVAAEPNRSGAGIALLDAVISALDRIDRNRGFREGKVRWEPLPLEWLASLFSGEQPGAEARLALALVSAFPETLPFASFRFGVQWAREQNSKYEYDWAAQPRRFEHSKVPPARWVWGPGELARVLGVALSRRLLEEAKLDATHTRRPRGRVPLPATTSQVRQWLSGDLDESLFSAWLARLALFDWRRVPQAVLALIPKEASAPRADGELALFGLIQPLIDQSPLVIRDLSPDDLFAGETGARTTETARSLVTLIRAGNIDAARRLASGRYAMAGARLASFEAPFATHHPDRLASALLFSISRRDRAVLFERWLRPRRRPQRGEAHV
ncbi:MAG: type I-U CRISPR-associated protein Csx17 [Gemmatimonadales bacterium]|nr:type I-U CRISPR-associated protein Csx17 [Gemmatimonadales bacterium]